MLRHSDKLFVLKKHSPAKCRKSARRRSRRLESLEERVVPAGAPALSSLPSASAFIYLDFDGNTLSFDSHYKAAFKDDRGNIYNGPIETPAFSLDVFETVFSDAEVAAIREIWQRVAEDFSPFNINVTTVDPFEPVFTPDGDVIGIAEDYADRVGLHVVIGGRNDDWLRKGTHEDWRPNSGYSGIGSFSNPDLPNVVFAFSKTIQDWEIQKKPTGDNTPIQTIPVVANTISHEVGHSFGLRHQSVWQADKLNQEYNTGDAYWTPIMGENVVVDRTTWFNGLPVTSSTNPQDDMAIMYWFSGKWNGMERVLARYAWHIL